MKNIQFKSIFIIIFLVVCSLPTFADSYSEAEDLIKKAETASIKEESYDCINAAREIYKQRYEQDPDDIEALLGLSKTYQMTQDRQEAKLYVSKAYNLKPYDPYLQREMGNFYFTFQEYSTAIEFYNLALASGLLEDFDTNLLVAKCYEKLGDIEKAELYYKICNHLNPESKVASKKVNAFESAKHEDNSQELEQARYKYLFKTKQISPEEQLKNETDDLIKQINQNY